MKLLYFCSSSKGGLADYAHEQCKALGSEVTLLCPADFPHEAVGYQQDRSLVSTLSVPGRWRNRFRIFQVIFTNFARLDRAIHQRGSTHVLFWSFTEYLSPLWAGRFRKWKQRGVKFSAIVHDPVRDHVVGPEWWHDLSVKQGYSFLEHGFVHQEIALPIASSVIPHGPFSFPESKEDCRAKLDIPSEARLLLSFGHLRDNKNLDLILKALVDHPETYLLVAGSEAPSGQAQAATYQEQARALGVDSRCRWEIAHISESAAADYFHASDLVMLTYDQSFCSASGVLNVAAQFQKPVIASSGEGPLPELLKRYAIGHWCDPDSAEAISAALAKPLPSLDWNSYLADNSWEKSVQLIRQAIL